MRKCIDIKDVRYGKLVALNQLSSVKGKTYWECICDCGNIISVQTNNLRGGFTKSCGCLSSNKNKKYVLKKIEERHKFGMLIMEDVVVDTGKETKVLCRCDCGNISTPYLKDLKNGKTKSCGCLTKQPNKYRKNEVGNRYGRLVVLRANGYNSNDCLKWDCKCDCGSEINVDGSNLRSGKVLSCGCLLSKSEELIANVFVTMGIPFKKQVTFHDCRTEKGNRLRFDFAVLDELGAIKMLIEYDGEQHFKEIPYFCKDVSFVEKSLRDRTKDEYCKNKGINLIRINYKDNLENAMSDVLIKIMSNT